MPHLHRWRQRIVHLFVGQASEICLAFRSAWLTPTKRRDDFVILSRGHADEALAWTDAVMTRLGLTLNRTKTRLCDARTDRFDFLGYSFGPHCHRQQGRWFTGASPSKKSVQRLKDKLGAILVPGNKGPWDEVRGTLNRLLRGWCGYFSPGTHYVTRDRGPLV
jgi:RNA-directed DNA polymerase